MSVPVCPFGFFCESGDLAVHLQPLIAIGSEIPAQLIAFMNKLFQLCIHPGDQSFANHFDEDGLYLDLFGEITEGLKTFGQGPD